MNNHWSLDTHGDPLRRVHDFIRHIWLASNLDGMLVTLNGGDEPHATPRYVTDIASIDRINPFKPLMEMNAARLIPGLLADRPGMKIGALLRPCEMRALTEMAKHTPINWDRLITISVDCLGTLPADEYQWRLERVRGNLPSDEHTSVTSNDELAHEALKFARQGGIIPYRYRPACQVCTSPAARWADINLHVLGLPVRQQMLVSLTNQKTANAIHLDQYADRKADQALLTQHERILSKMAERHQRTMDRVNEGLGSLLPADVDAVIRQLENCIDCQDCMDVCPICSVDRPGRLADGHYDRSSVMRWLVSCAGCGMCEQACPNHLPISAIFGHIRKQLDQQWEYVPGRSINDPLPQI
ncbi:MAG: Coenzyme F420 hydrogenase/dehydrogenase, beta subunit C-terminal domain [Anaerolineales bacterium]